MRLSVQLYTVRDHLTQDLPGTLQKIKEIGFDFVELAGFYDRSASEWKILLDSLGLKASGAHIGLLEMEADPEKVSQDAKTLGLDTVIIPWIGADLYGDGWDNFALRVNSVAQKFSAFGVAVAYHNHDFEFAGGGFDKFYSASDPSIVFAELDLAWVSIGGEDPVAWVDKLGPRVRFAHVKDYDKSKTPQWTPAGQGVMNFDAILPALEAAGTRFAVVELDESPGDPLDAVAQSYAYFVSKGLK